MTPEKYAALAADRAVARNEQYRLTPEEAAERLRDQMIEHAPAPLVEQYKQAVIRATVERIRERLALADYYGPRIDAILDEEAAR